MLLVAPSGAGKGMNNFQLIKKLDYEELTSGSLEGMKDAAMVNPHLLISLQEFGSVLEGKGYKEDFKKGLTDMFNRGSFTDALSVRKSKEIRTVDWFYPVVYGSVQPEVLRRAGRSLDIAQGLFGRFLIGYLSEEDAEYDFNPCNPDQDNDLRIIQKGLCKIAALHGVIVVPNPHYNTNFSHPLRHVIDSRLVPLLLRYANEYLPRIALMLALPDTITSAATIELPQLTPDHFQRAATVLYWIFAMAEKALGSLTDLEGRSRQQEDNIRRMVRLQNRMTAEKEKITLAEISRRSSDSGWDAKIRIGILNEMIQRDYIEVRHPQ